MSTPATKQHRPLNLHDARILQAIALVFEGRLSRVKVAENVQVSVRTLARWLLRLFQMAEGKSVYRGFGMTNWTYLKTFPWYNVDEST